MMKDIKKLTHVAIAMPAERVSSVVISDGICIEYQCETHL